MGVAGDMTAIAVSVSPSVRQNYIPPPASFYQDPAQGEMAEFRQPIDASPRHPQSVYKMSPTPEQVCPVSNNCRAVAHTVIRVYQAAAEKASVDEVAKHKFRTSLKAHKASGGSYLKHRATWAANTGKKPRGDGQNATAVSIRYKKIKSPYKVPMVDVRGPPEPEPEEIDPTPWYKKSWAFDQPHEVLCSSLCGTSELGVACVVGRRTKVGRDRRRARALLQRCGPASEASSPWE